MEPLNKLFLDLEVVFNPDYCVSHDEDEIVDYWMPIPELRKEEQ